MVKFIGEILLLSEGSAANYAKHESKLGFGIRS